MDWIESMSDDDLWSWYDSWGGDSGGFFAEMVRLVIDARVAGDLHAAREAAFELSRQVVFEMARDLVDGIGNGTSAMIGSRMQSPLENRNYVVDRIVDEEFVVLEDEDGNIIVVPLSSIGGRVTEGAVINFNGARQTYTVDAFQTLMREKEFRDIRERFNRLFEENRPVQEPNQPPTNGATTPFYRGERLTADNISDFDFISIEEAIIAFAIVFHSLSVYEQQEWGGRVGPGYAFDFINNSLQSLRGNIPENDEWRYTVTIPDSRNAEAIVHTHWDTDPNRYQGFSPDDIRVAGSVARSHGRDSWTEFVVRPDGSIVYKVFDRYGNHGGERILNIANYWDHDSTLIEGLRW